MSNQVSAQSLLIEAKQLLEKQATIVTQVNAQTHHAENNQLSLKRDPRNLNKKDESRYETTIQIPKKSDGSQSAVALIELSVKVNQQSEIYQLRFIQKDGEKFIQKDIEIENNQIKKISVSSDSLKEVFEYENDELKNYSSEGSQSEIGYKKIVKLLEKGKAQEGKEEYEKSINPYNGKAHFSEIEGNAKYSAGLFLQNIKGDSFFDYIMDKISQVTDKNKQEITIGVLNDFVSIFKAVDDYHAQGYVHLDLKHDNFMTDGKNFVIIDHLSKTEINSHAHRLTTKGFTHPDRLRLRPVLAAKKHDYYSISVMLEQCILQIGIELIGDENSSFNDALEAITKNSEIQSAIKTLIADLKEKELDSLESSIEKINSIIQLINQPECEVKVEEKKVVLLSQGDNPDQKIKTFLKLHLGESEQFSSRLSTYEEQSREFPENLKNVANLKSALLKLAECHGEPQEIESIKKELTGCINKFGFIQKKWFNEDAGKIFASMEKSNAPSHVEKRGMFQRNSNSMEQSNYQNNVPQIKVGCSN